MGWWLVTPDRSQYSVCAGPVEEARSDAAHSSATTRAVRRCARQEEGGLDGHKLGGFCRCPLDELRAAVRAHLRQALDQRDRERHLALALDQHALRMHARARTCS